MHRARDTKERQLSDRKPLAEASIWDGKHGLVLTDEHAVKKLDKPYLSASTMKSMSGCTARWAAEKLLPQTEDPFGPAEQGSVVHQVLEDMYALPAADRNLEWALGELRKQADALFPTGGPDRDRWMVEVVRALFGLWSIEDPHEVRVIGRETRIGDGTKGSSVMTVDGTDYDLAGATIAGVPIQGFVDRIDAEDSTGWVVPLDYKTSKKTPDLRYGDDHGDQLRLYSLAIGERTGRTPSEARVFYTKLGTSKRVAMSKTAMRSTEKKFVASWNSLRERVDTRTFPTQPGALCGWCPLVLCCPTAKSEGLDVDRRGGALSPERGPGAVLLPQVPLATGDDTPTVEETPRVDSCTEGVDDPTDIIEDVTASFTKEHTMTNFPLPDLKPYDLHDSRGNLNAGSYGVLGMYATATMAVEQVMASPVKKKSPRLIKAIATLFAQVIMDAQEQVTGKRDWQGSVNTRARGMLRTVLDLAPLPWDGDAQAWEDWREQAAKRIALITATAFALEDEDQWVDPLVELGAVLGFETADDADEDEGDDEDEAPENDDDGEPWSDYGYEDTPYGDGFDDEDETYDFR